MEKKFESFEYFNKAREELSQNFYELISLIGNSVFNGEIDIKKHNLLKEINNQENLSEPEKNVLRHIYFYTENLKKSKFLIGVVGRFKSGKSTILNALAGQNISPMDTRISTGVLNFTYWNEKEECIVVYDTGNKIPIDPNEKIFYVDFKHNPDNEKGIHSVRHGSPNLDLQKEIVFVDTPGLEAVNRIHEKITLDFITQCHAAIIVSTYPPFGETELKFYERIKKDILHIFLVQNLPEDKLSDWVELETQTLFNLYKLGFFKLSSEYKNYENQLRDFLNKIADKKDQNSLEKFKQAHNIKLYSLNGKVAYLVIVEKNYKDEEEAKKKLEESRFLKFKRDLYEFLDKSRGLELIRNYIKKGDIIVTELIKMIEVRKNLFSKSLQEIEDEIKSLEKRKEETLEKVNMLVDRANLKILESFKEFKNKVMNDKLEKFLEELDKNFGGLNIFTLKRAQLKEIKSKIAEFNREFGQFYQESLKNIQKILLESEENISKILEQHGIFSKLEINTNFSPVSMGEISGAGYIEYGLEVLYRGGLAYILGSLAGGGGIALLGPGLIPILIGAGIGIALSFPLDKYVRPYLEGLKGLIGKLFNKPVKNIFNEFKNNVRFKLDELEKYFVDEMSHKFKEEVSKNIEEYFKAYSQKLEELKNKKAQGMTLEECKKECDKLQEIIDQLQNLKKQFSKLGEIEELKDSKIDNIFKGIKSYLKKLGT